MNTRTKVLSGIAGLTALVNTEAANIQTKVSANGDGITSDVKIYQNANELDEKLPKNLGVFARNRSVYDGKAIKGLTIVDGIWDFGDTGFGAYAEGFFPIDTSQEHNPKPFPRVGAQYSGKKSFGKIGDFSLYASPILGDDRNTFFEILGRVTYQRKLNEKNGLSLFGQVEAITDFNRSMGNSFNTQRYLAGLKQANGIGYGVEVDFTEIPGMKPNRSTGIWLGWNW